MGALLTSCFPHGVNSVFDGKALPQPYKAPNYTGPEPTAEIENGRICKHHRHRHVVPRPCPSLCDAQLLTSFGRLPHKTTVAAIVAL